MAYKIVLNIRSEITSTGEEPQIMEFMTAGKLFEKDGALYIIYEETELSGMPDSKTMLKFKDGTCTLHRYGPNQSQMTFEKGVIHETQYSTPYGTFQMETKGRKIEADLESGIFLLLYDLVISGLNESVNRLDITIIKREPAEDIQE